MSQSLTDKQKLFIEYFSQTGKAVEKLKKLIENDKTTPSVQLGAINSLLDRTGYQTTTKIEDVTGRKTDAELQAELDHLLGTLKVTKIIPTDDGSSSIN